MTDTQALILVAVMALTTAAIRFAPFVLFDKKTPDVILKLTDVLPYAAMGMLVVYCLKSVDLLAGTHGIPELVSIVLVVLLHKWKHNTLVSIIGGTVCYMLLIRMM